MGVIVKRRSSPESATASAGTKLYRKGGRVKRAKASFVVRADDENGFRMIKDIVNSGSSAKIVHESPTRHALAILISPGSHLLREFKSKGLQVYREATYVPEGLPKA